jgi:hypothetical protein
MGLSKILIFLIKFTLDSKAESVIECFHITHTDELSINSQGLL